MIVLGDFYMEEFWCPFAYLASTAGNAERLFPPRAVALNQYVSAYGPKLTNSTHVSIFR
jgi:hypothetical protein